MFEKEQKRITLNRKEMEVIVRKNTLDEDLLRSANEYRFDEINFKNGNVVIDIGAYNGGEAIYFQTLSQPLRIYSYEPLPENFELLEENLKQFKNAFAFQKAVGGENKKVKIFYGDLDYKGEGGSWGEKYHFMGNIKKPYRGKKFVEVEEITLERIFEDNKIEKCRLVKIDTEGNELEILKSCPEKILKKIDYIIGDLHQFSSEELLKQTKEIFENFEIPSPNLFRFKNKYV